MSSVGKGVRFVLGLSIVAIGIYLKSWWGALGFLPLLGVLTGECPLCSIFNGTQKCSSTSDSESKDQREKCGEH